VRRGRFYEEMTEEGKWEFINGETIMHSPAKSKHSAASDFLYLLLAAYVNQRALGRVAHEKLLVCLERNDYEPDLCFYKAEKAAAFTPDQMKFPAPDFIARCFRLRRKAIDRGVKFIDYARSGVGEYWIIDPEEETVENTW
jgi:Uma2 family endonuclease